MNEQLEKDLVRKLTERLKQACKDHVTLCEIAEIDPSSGASIMFATIAAFLAECVAETTHMDPEEFGESMANAVRLIRAQAKNNEQQG